MKAYRKIVYVKGNMSPSRKEYSKTVEGYTKWRIYENPETNFTSEKVLRINVMDREIPQKKNR